MSPHKVAPQLLVTPVTHLLSLYLSVLATHLFLTLCCTHSSHCTRLTHWASSRRLYHAVTQCSSATPPTSSRRLATRFTTPLTKYTSLLDKSLTTFYSRAKPLAWNFPIRTLSRPRRLLHHKGACTDRN